MCELNSNSCPMDGINNIFDKASFDGISTCYFSENVLNIHLSEAYSNNSNGVFMTINTSLIISYQLSSKNVFWTPLLVEELTII